jgi:glycosyltransferase involved in cell wall biosynthesis
VVAADIPALREVSGEGAMLVDPADRGAWTQAISRLLSDEPLRAEMVSRGRDMVARYSWDETARGVCALLDDVAGARASRR